MREELRPFELRDDDFFAVERLADPPLAPARLRFAAVLAAFALVRAVFAADLADLAAERARLFVVRLDLRELVDLRERLLLVERDRLELELRELLRFLDDDRRRVLPPFRSAAGTSARAALRASFGISFSR